MVIIKEIKVKQDLPPSVQVEKRIEFLKKQNSVAS